MLNHVQAAGVQRDGEKVLQAGGKGLQWARTRGLQDCLRSRMQHQVSIMQYQHEGAELYCICPTRYVEKLPGQFLADSQCEKLPVEICGAGCTFEEGPEKCHDKVISKLFDEYQFFPRNPSIYLLQF